MRNNRLMATAIDKWANLSESRTSIQLNAADSQSVTATSSPRSLYTRFRAPYTARSTSSPKTFYKRKCFEKCHHRLKATTHLSSFFLLLQHQSFVCYACYVLYHYYALPLLFGCSVRVCVCVCVCAREAGQSTFVKSHVGTINYN